MTLEQLTEDFWRQVSAVDAPFTVPDMYLELRITAPGTQDGALGLAWTETLAGDTDQSGQVDEGDLAPLLAEWGRGVQYSQQGSPLDYSTTLDADRNGVIGAGDVAVLAKHYHERVLGFRVYRRLLAGGAWTLLPDPLHPESTLSVGRDAIFPTRYIDTTSPLGELEYRVVPVADVNSSEAAGERIAVRHADPWEGSKTDIHAPDHVFVGQGADFELVIRSGVVGAGLLQLDLEADGTSEFALPVPIDGAPDQRTFTRELTFMSPGRHSLRTRFEDDQGNVSFADVTFKVFPANSAPQITARYLLSSNEAPASLMMTDVNTYDPDQDWCSLSIRLDRHDQGGLKRIDFSLSDWIWLTTPGSYTLTITATDPYGAATTWTRSFNLTAKTASPGWRVSTVTTELPPFAPSPFTFTGAMVGGRPTVVIDSNHDLRYLRSTDASGQQWPALGAALQLSAPADNYGVQDLIEVNGRAAVRLVSTNPAHQAYRVQTDAGSSTWSPAYVFPESQMGDGQLTILGDRPAAVWTNADHQFFFAQANDEYGLSWPATPQRPQIHTAWSPSLLELEGHAVLTYVDFRNNTVVLSAPQLNQASWTVAGSLDGQRYCTTPPGAAPVFLRFAEKRVPSGQWSAPSCFVQLPLHPSPATWGAPQLVPIELYDLASATGGGSLGDATIINGRMTVATVSTLTNSPTVIAARDAFGTTWDAPLTVDAAGAAATGYPTPPLVLIDAGGKPGLFYVLRTAPAEAGQPARFELRYAVQE